MTDRPKPGVLWWLGTGADAAREAVVSFRAEPGNARWEVEFASETARRRLPAGVAAAGTRSPFVYRHTHLMGLQPGSAVRVSLLRDGAPSGVSATVRPVRSDQVTITTFGDAALTADSEANLRTAALYEPDLHVHVGDVGYANATGWGLDTDVIDPGVWDRFLALTAPLSQRCPYLTVPGNDDMEPGTARTNYANYLARFPLIGTPAIATDCPARLVRAGPLSLLLLDANDVSGEIGLNQGYTSGAQTRWLRRTLSELAAERPRRPVIAFLHHCMYGTCGRHGSDGGVRDAWQPVFDEYGVALVVSGHNHVYERTHQIRAGSVACELEPGGVTTMGSGRSEGTVYMCVGAGGHSLYHDFTWPRAAIITRQGRRLEPAPWSAVRETETSFAVVQCASSRKDGTRIRVRAVTPAGRTLDAFELVAPNDLTTR